MIGQTISHFKITDKLGEGGMGQVYRATDSKLGREVALKVLPDLFASDAERMARFQREAQVLASLNHTHIAGIHGLEEVDGKKFLVLELVEGETLEQRIRRGPIPLEEALPIALQIAQALEAAHDKGIIHRDLKPGNVKLTPAGEVKVLDFGLAKAMAGDPGSSGSFPQLTQSPTLTAQMTEAGVLLGTAAYMSPEQARGLAADRRADIWAFGVVLTEMLTGKMVYGGETVTDTLAGVLAREPDWEDLPKSTPQAVERLLHRCLQKDPKQRLQAIGEARISLESYLADPEAAVEAPAAVAAQESRPLWQRALPWAVAGLLAAALIVALWPKAQEPAPVVRLTTVLDDENLFIDQGAAAVLSPDGRRLAYVSGNDSSRRMYLRSMDQLHATEMAGGSIAINAPYNPFFSPDGRWVGFVTPDELKKMPVTGGTPITLCELERSRGATWLEDDTIVFASSPNSGLSRVPATGGTPELLTTLNEDEGEATHRWPQGLPGGKAVIFTSAGQAASWDDANIEAVTVATGERKVLHRGGHHARYAPSGHLIYVNEGTLFAVPFDPDSLEVTGSPSPVVEGVATSPSGGGAHYSFSETGDLIYAGGEGGIPEYPALWVDRDGSSKILWQEPGPVASPAFSPDGGRLALSVYREDNLDVWVFDLERTVATRLTFHEGYDGDQIWSPDGSYLAFASDRDGQTNLYRKRADGSGDVEQLSELEQPTWPTSWSPDGRYILAQGVGQASDLWILDLQEGNRAELYLATEFSEEFAAFSPNGRWVAYQSNESGRFEIYVRPFPVSGGKWQISDKGGGQPRWSTDGRELFYRNEDGVMVVSVEIGGQTFVAGKPRALFQGNFRGGIFGTTLGPFLFGDYDVAPDGRRFVMFPRDLEQGPGSQVTLVFNWFDELKRLLSGKS